MKRNIIEFETLGLQMPDIDIRRVREWIITLARDKGFEVKRIAYLFVDDEEILRLNRQSLGHDYYTDIITFDYTRGSLLSGEMVISLDTVRTNADRVGESYDRELLRVIIHGVLHLVGINDKGPGEREIMEREENMALDLYDHLQMS